MNKYSVCAISLIAVIYVSGAQAWFVRVLNDTDGVIDVTVTNVLCKDDFMSIQPGKEGTADTLLCCYKAVAIEGKSGSIQGKKASYNPSNTCMHTYLIAEKDKSNNLLLKERVSSVVVSKKPLQQNSVKPSLQKDSVAAQEIIKSALGGKKGEYTQTEALVSLANIQDKIKQLPHVAEVKQIFFDALAKERAMNKDYYVFYTAIPHMRVFQDVMRKLYQLKVGKIGALQDKAFQFVRYAYKDAAYNEYKSVTDFLVKEFQKNGIVDDNQLNLKTILLSTNLAFWGNIGLPGESTYNYLFSPAVWVEPRRAWLEQAFTSFGYGPNNTKQIIDQLIELSKSIQTTTSDLFQIFVPKSLINQIGYLAWRLGIPFDQDFIQAVLHNPHLESLGNVPYADLRKEIDIFKKQWLDKDRTAIALVATMIKNIKAGKYYLSLFLNQYETKPQSINDIVYHQARLLITNDGLLNPASGLKVYRYSLLDKKREAAYKAALKNLLKPLSDQKGSALN